MKNFLLILTLGIMFSAAQILDAQNPCPCDCDDIIYSTHSSPPSGNKILLGKKLGSNCYESYIQLRACGNRTLEGFSMLLPDPNCIEDKTVAISMDGEYIETVDLSNTSVPSFFQLDEPLQPCTTRDITFTICFPENDDECLDEEYDIQVDFQTTGGESPCPTQTVSMHFDRILGGTSVAIESSLNDLFEINGESLQLKNLMNIGTIEIYNIQGKKVGESFSESINTSHLKSGAYLILVKSDGKLFQTKLIKNE